MLDSAGMKLAQLFVCSTNSLPSEKLQAIYMNLFSSPILLVQHRAIQQSKSP